MPRKLILEMSVYTDGDWGFDESLFSNYTSKYFENEVYEYTRLEDYSCKIRRVFEDTENGYKEIAHILIELKESIRCRDKYTADMLNEFFDAQVEATKSYPEFYDDIDSNTEISIRVYTLENDSRRIKSIVFEDDALADGTNLFGNIAEDTYAISATVRWGFGPFEEPRTLYAGEESEHSNNPNYPFWFPAGDPLVLFFNSVKQAEEWFDKAKRCLCHWVNMDIDTEIKDIHIVKIGVISSNGPTVVKKLTM